LDFARFGGQSVKQGQLVVVRAEVTCSPKSTHSGVKHLRSHHRFVERPEILAHWPDGPENRGFQDTLSLMLYHPSRNFLLPQNPSQNQSLKTCSASGEVKQLASC
jgi:hypothetical protein